MRRTPIPKPHTGQPTREAPRNKKQPRVAAPPSRISRTEWTALRTIAERYAGLVGGPGGSAVIHLLEQAVRAEEWFKDRCTKKTLGQPATLDSDEAAKKAMRREVHSLMSGEGAPLDVNPMLCRYIFESVRQARAGDYFVPGGSYTELRRALADMIPRTGRGRRFRNRVFNEWEAVGVFHMSQRGMSDEMLREIRERTTGKKTSLSMIRSMKSQGRKALGEKPVRVRKPRLPR